MSLDSSLHAQHPPFGREILRAEQIRGRQQIGTQEERLCLHQTWPHHQCLLELFLFLIPLGIWKEQERNLFCFITYAECSQEA